MLMKEEHYTLVIASRQRTLTFDKIVQTILSSSLFIGIQNNRQNGTHAALSDNAAR